VRFRGIPVWKFSRGIDLALIAEVARDRLLEPDLHVEIVSTTKDALTVAITQGTVPDDSSELLFLADHGAYEVARRFWWPERAGPGVLLTLTPSR
jgi:hypothetical protein